MAVEMEGLGGTPGGASEGLGGTLGGASERLGGTLGGTSEGLAGMLTGAWRRDGLGGTLFNICIDWQLLTCTPVFIPETKSKIRIFRSLILFSLQNNFRFSINLCR